MSERENGILFGSGDSVYFVPEGRLQEFQLPADAAQQVQQQAPSEVEGFSTKNAQLRPNVKTLDWGFQGPIRGPEPQRSTYSLNPTG